MSPLLVALITSATMAGWGTGLVAHEVETGAIITELGYFTPAQQVCVVLGDPDSFINEPCRRP